MSRGADALLLRQFLSFTAVGAVGTAAHYATLIALVQVFHAHAVVSSAAGFTVGALVNYSLNYRLTFRSTKLHHDSMPRFFLVAIIGLALNTGIMALLTEAMAVHYLVAQVVATLTVLGWTFTANRLWTFR
jgi:putative flippase GtrA